MPKDLDYILNTLEEKAIDQKIKAIDTEGLSDIGALCKKLVEARKEKAMHEKAVEDTTEEIQSLSETIGTILKKKI